MKFYLQLLIAVLFLLNFIECLIFVKSLHDDKYPGQCYPVHVRIGAMKKYDLIALKPGEEANDPNTCGTTVCMNSNGLAYVYYCPRTLPSSACDDDKALNTIAKFPECCWNCSKSKNCKEKESIAEYSPPSNNQNNTK